MDNKPTLHYVIDHISLKNFVLENSDSFIKIVEGGPENLKGFLAALWNDIKSRNTSLRNSNDNITKDNFNVSIGVIDDNIKLLIIVMPEVKEVLEASIIGILLADNLRYFTLEYNKSILDGKEKYMLCEWDKNEKHLNYGNVENSSIQLFLDGVVKVLYNK